MIFPLEYDSKEIVGTKKLSAFSAFLEQENVDKDRIIEIKINLFLINL